MGKKVEGFEEFEKIKSKKDLMRMDEDDIRRSRQSAWNMSESLVRQMSFLWWDSTRACVKGDYQKCFIHTEEIRLIIHNDLTNEQAKEVDAIADNIRQIYKEWRIVHNKLSVNSPGYQERIKEETNRRNDLREKHRVLVNVYRKKISVLLGIYGYHMTKRRDETRIF